MDEKTRNVWITIAGAMAILLTFAIMHDSGLLQTLLNNLK